VLSSSAIRLISFAGLVLAVYALYVEYMMAFHREGFVALCDFGSWASCSKVLTSEHSHLFFDIPNAAMGALFYVACMLYTLLTFIPFRRQLYLLATLFSSALSIYLATVLYAMGDFCALCVSTYLVNFALLATAVLDIRREQKRSRKMRRD